MLLQEEEIQVLVNMGLSILQARAFMALVRLGEAKAFTISHVSKISRMDVYRVLFGLQEMGLIEKIIGTPTRFRAVPVEDAFSILLERKKTDYVEVDTKAKCLLQKLKGLSTAKDSALMQPEMILISDEEARKRRMIRLFEEAKTSVDFVTKWNYLANSMGPYFDAYLGCLKRGVKLRYVANKPLRRELPEGSARIFEHKLFSLRLTPTPPDVIVGIFDRKDVAIASVGNVDGPVPMFYTSCDSILLLSQKYFDTMWNKTTAETEFWSR